MGGFGRCCCGECECLPFVDLPDVSISGWTGDGWSGVCCYEQTFTPNAAQSWSKTCTSDVFSSTVSESCETEHYHILTPDYRGYELFPDGCETIPDDFCCPEGDELIATTNSEWTFENKGFFAFWRRIKEIIVRISREDVNCEGVEGQTGGCKIVIRSRYVYEVRSRFYKNDRTSSSQTVTMNNSTCFEKDDNYEFDNALSSAFTCDDVPSTPPDSIIQENCLEFVDVYFDRVKYYDDMPTGSISFGNTDVPGCTSSSCNYDPYNYTNQVCIYTPSEEVTQTYCLFSEPCYCTDDVFPVSNSITQTFSCTKGLITEIGGCNANPCIPMLCNVIITDCSNDDPPFDCGYQFTRNQLQYDIDPENPATCFVEGIGGGIYNACGASYGIEGVGGSDSRPYTRLITCDDPTDCNSSCCRYYDDCPCCVPDGTCIPIHSTSYYSTVISHTRTQTCSGITSLSFCTNAPTWTITLS